MFKTFAFSEMSKSDVYRLMVSAIVPRPIAFVSTLNEEGLVNLAPFSFYNAISSQPPCLAISVIRKPGGEKKDTLRNIETHGEFVVNSTHEWLADQVNQTSGNYAPHVSEMKEVGLTSIPSVWIKTPRIRESLIQMECKLEKIVDIGLDAPEPTALIIGRILGTHISEDIITQGQIDISKYLPLSRLGGMSWGKTREVFELVRPK